MKEENSEHTLKALYNQFVLGNSVFKFQHEISATELDATIDVVELEKRHIAEQLAYNIIREHKSSIVVTDTPTGGKLITCKLLVLKMDSFKSIVEAAIQTMPMEAILKIRGEV